MSTTSPNVRDTLGVSANPNRFFEALREMGFGDLVALLIRGLTPTETGVVPSAHVATLANTPANVFQVNATTATSTGIKTLLKGKISGVGAVVPKAGECVWEPGTKKVLFNVADAVTAASFTYSTGTEAASCLPRIPGQIDTP